MVVGLVVVAEVPAADVVLRLEAAGAGQRSALIRDAKAWLATPTVVSPYPPGQL